MSTVLTQKSAPIMIRRLSLPYKLPTLTPKPNIRKVIRLSEDNNTTSKSAHQATTQTVAVPIKMKLPVQKIVSKIARRTLPSMCTVQNSQSPPSINSPAKNIPKISSIKTAPMINKMNGRKMLPILTRRTTIANLRTYSRQTPINGGQSSTLSNGNDGFVSQSNHTDRLPPLKSAQSAANLM